jgi:hypothetical protein
MKKSVVENQNSEARVRLYLNKQLGSGGTCLYFQLCGRCKVGESWSEDGIGKSARLYLKITKRGWDHGSNGRAPS